jgi:hypothetical protein
MPVHSRPFRSTPRSLEGWQNSGAGESWETAVAEDDAVETEGPAGPDTSEIVMYVSGVLLLVASFLPLLRLDLDMSDDDIGFGAFFGAFIETEWSTWSNAFSIFPLVSVPVLSVLVLVAARALSRFTDTNVPERLFGFSAPALRVAAAAFAGVTISLHILRALIDGGGEGDDGSLVVGAGGWLAAAAIAAIVVTAINEDRPTTQGGSERGRPDSRATATTMIGGVIVLIASFLDAWSAPDEDGLTSWSEGARPVYLAPLAMTVLVAVATAADSMAGEPRSVLGVDIARWRVLLAGMGVFAALALLIGNPVFGSFDSFIDTGAGVYLSILGAGVAFVGTLLKPAQQAASAQLDPDPPAAPPGPPTQA